MSRIDKLINSMTLKEKLAQMICVRAFDFRDKINEMVSQGLIGAIGASVITVKGIKELDGVVAEINKYNKCAKQPLMFYVDAETGVPYAFNFGTSFPSLMALGATFSKELSYKYGNIVGKEANALGFTIVSNPVLDINSNPDNPIVNTRAISDNPELIIELATEYVKGMQDACTIPTGKHFPGHGDTSVDSHVSMPIVEHDREYLMNLELKTFKKLIEHGMLGIMTAHILYPNLLGEGEDRVPATLSKNIITNILRNEFNFEGLIVSDSLTMKGIKDQYGLEKAAVMAVKAGHDIILQDYLSDPEITLNALADAVNSGELDIKQINDSVRRLLSLYERLETLENRQIDIEIVKQIVGCSEHIEVAKEIADKSVTVLEAKHLPFHVSKNEKVLVIATKSEEEGTIAEDLHMSITAKAAYLHKKCKEYSKNVDICTVSENPSMEDIERIKEMADQYDYFIYSSFVRVISYKEGSGTIQESQVKLINCLENLGKKSVFIIYGSPYVLRKIQSPNNCICTYCDCNYSIDASLKVLFGKMNSQGKLPVNVNKKYVYGYGL